MESIKKYKVKPILTVQESDLLAGLMLEEKHCTKLLTSSCDVYDSESGRCLAKFRKNIIPPKMQLDAFNALLSAAKESSNRGTAGGVDLGIEGTGGYKVKKDGTLSKTWRSSSSLRPLRKSGVISKTAEVGIVRSGIVGYFDRNARFPYCRLTAFNQQHLDRFNKALPIIKFVDSWYAKLMPYEYGLQRELADHTSQDFVIKGTAFTTVTVNRNWQTAVHKDSGDYRYGFGNLLALRQGTYTGGWLCLPRWGIGFDLRNGDLLLMDVHQWHGNTPIVLEDKNAIRLSLVMYYREKMIQCGTMKQEIERAKRRQKGDKL